MANINPLQKLGQILLPKSVPVGAGVAATPTFNPQQSAQVLAALPTDNHIGDLLDTRRQTSDNDLIATLMQYDPDVAAAVSAYLTIANTPMRIICRDINGQIDTGAQATIEQLLTQISFPIDYTVGFTPNRSLQSRNEKLRYMILKRGAVSVEMILDKTLGMTDLRLIDPNSLK